MTWFAGRGGRRVECLDPVVAEVDWREIAEALARINRYGGHAETPCSVAQHTLIVAEAAPPALKPLALLHDAHEARLQDTTSPVKETWLACAEQIYGQTGRVIIAGVRRELEFRHDCVIHAAAGLARPTPEEKRLIKALDLAALATERRDFFGGRPLGEDWIIDRERVEPLRKVYRFMPWQDAADALLAAFHQWLPALRRQPVPRRA